MSHEIPPFCIEAEEAILGGCLLDPQAITFIKDYLHRDAFYATSHKEIYEAMLRLNAFGKPTDLISVTNWLADHNQLTYAGGRNKLSILVDNAISSINLDALAELVMEKYLRRELIKAGKQIVQLGHQAENELPAILDKAQQKIFNISNLNFQSNTEHNNEIIDAAYDELRKPIQIYSTGLKNLDKLMVGLEPGTLTVVAGRASMGKSFIATNLALEIMLLHKLPVAIFSLEMTKKQLEYRLWSMISVHDYYQHLKLSPLESDRIRRHRGGEKPLKEWEFENIDKIVVTARELPLYINDCRKISVAGIASACRQIAARQGKLGLVIIDYLQMMAEDSDTNRSYSLGNVARSIYQMSGDLNIPVLLLSQISRAVESRPNKRPMMSDLSQSGIIEMVADNIILAYRDEYYYPNTNDEGILELILAKARHGETGTAKVLFDKSFGVMKNLEAYSSK